MILRSERIPFSNYTTMQVGLPQRKVRKQTENEFRGFVYLISKKLEKQTLLGIELQKKRTKTASHLWKRSRRTFVADEDGPKRSRRSSAGNGNWKRSCRCVDEYKTSIILRAIQLFPVVLFWLTRQQLLQHGVTAVFCVRLLDGMCELDTIGTEEWTASFWLSKHRCS